MSMDDNIFQGRVRLLWEKMKEENLDAYLIPMGDYHGSEYISEHFGLIAYYSGFTGSAGTLLVTNEAGRMQAYLWTDGRYFLQAGSQLEGTGILLMKQGEKGVPTVGEKLADANIGDGPELRLGFDGKVVIASYAEKLRKEIEKKRKVIFLSDRDFAGELWQQDSSDKRPPLPAGAIWELPVEYTGLSRKDKLTVLREKMIGEGASCMVFAMLDEIAYLLNLRGSDVAYNPVFLAFLIVYEKGLTLYVNAKELPECLTKDDGIRVKPYESFYPDLKSDLTGKKVWFDEDGVSFLAAGLIEGSAQGCIKKPSPVILQKAVKTRQEVEGEKLAHIKDGVAVTKWICALKKLEREAEEGKQSGSLTELGAAGQLEELRKAGEHYLGQSFAPIIAFGANGAIVHYEPEPETEAKILFGRGEYLLADTGGHYLEGTTDITRTVSLGKPDEEKRKLYTAVLRGHLQLLDAHFIEDAPGSSLDQLAREPLYRLGYDYRHGTGHGVGFVLNVHEGPNAFRMKYTAQNKIRENMVTSDEPGVYLEGRFGIRLESLIVSVFEKESEYGRFLAFRPLTMVPFDRDSIESAFLSEENLAVLNEYHETVYKTISPFLNEEEREWLRRETAPIEK